MDRRGGVAVGRERVRWLLEREWPAGGGRREGGSRQRSTFQWEDVKLVRLGSPERSVHPATALTLPPNINAMSSPTPESRAEGLATQALQHFKASRQNVSTPTLAPTRSH